MWYLKYLKNLLCIRVVAELFVLRVLLETQVYGLIFLDIMILIAEQIRAKIVEIRRKKLYTMKIYDRQTGVYEGKVVLIAIKL